MTGRYSPLPISDHDALLPLPVTANHSSPSTSARFQSALERLASTKSPPTTTSSSSSTNSPKGKGKAKAKANEPESRPIRQDEEAATGPTGMSFSVRFTEGEEDLVDLWVGEKATVREVKRRVSSFPAPPPPLWLIWRELLTSELLRN